MKIRVWGMLFLAATTSGGVARGQGGDPEADALRSKIREMQSQLESKQAADDQRRGVTRIGGSTRVAEHGELLLRVYDLHELFAMAPSYPAMIAPDFGPERRTIFPQATGATQLTGGGGGFGGGGFFNVGDMAKAMSHATEVQSRGQMGRTNQLQTSTDGLIKAITTSISPTEWTDAGGTFTIADLGTSLIISADENSHAQIEKLLDLLRERWKTLRTVSIQADWLWLSPAELNRIVVAAEKRGAGEPYGLVERNAWQETLDAAALAADGAKPMHAGVTCYNAQMVSVVSGAESAYVDSVAPTSVGGSDDEEDGSGGVLGYTPHSGVIFEGAALQLTPLVNKPGTVVTIDVHTRLSKKAERAAAPANRGEPGTARDAVSVLDLPKLAVSQLSTTVRVPVDRTMLVGGMDFVGEQGASGKGLYLFVTASMQELVDGTEEPVAPPVEETPK